MRTFDLSPLYRSTVGFDRLFSLLDQGIEGAAPGYPPYNIERTGDNEYRVIGITDGVETEIVNGLSEGAAVVTSTLSGSGRTGGGFGGPPGGSP